MSVKRTPLKLGLSNGSNLGSPMARGANMFRSEVFYSPIAASSTVNGRVIRLDFSSYTHYTHFGVQGVYDFTD